MTKIHIKHKSNYGVDHMYVCEPDLAVVITRLTGRRTVTHSDVMNLRALGIEVVDLDQVLQKMFA